MSRARTSVRASGCVDRGCLWAIIALLTGTSVAALAPLVPSVALADSNDDNLAAALKKFDQGKTAYDAGAFEEALLSFQASYSLSPSPNSRLAIARCFRALGKVASAYTNLRLAAREASDRMTSTGEKRYTATRDAANSEAAEIEPKVARVTLAVPAGMPSDFVLKKNGVEIARGAWGTAVETDTGPIVVEASGSRMTPFKQAVSLTEGQQLRIEVKTNRLPTAQVSLHLRSRPAGISVLLDQTPLDGAHLEAAHDIDIGPHTVTVSAPGYAPFEWKKTLNDTEVATVEVDLHADSRFGASASRGTPKWLFFSAGALGLGALGVATGLGVSAYSREQDELAKSPFLRDAETRTSIHTEATAANVLFVGGGVLAAGAAVLAFTTQWKSESTRTGIWILPAGDSRSGGLVAHGSF